MDWDRYAIQATALASWGVTVYGWKDASIDNPPFSITNPLVVSTNWTIFEVPLRTPIQAV